eukprot:gene13421-15813_t
MSERAYELLAIPDDIEGLLLLDIGCGSGISGDVITDHGHEWIGCDISADMLNVSQDREVEGDVLLRDMGQGLPFRAGTFDAAISISAIQWLCNAEKSHHNPRKRLLVFFQSLFSVLTRGGKAVLQFYPENSAQIDMITAAAMRCGFTGGLLVDFPNSTKAKKYFLVLFTGNNSMSTMPKAKGVGVEGEGDEETGVKQENGSWVKKIVSATKVKQSKPTHLTLAVNVDPDSRGQCDTPFCRVPKWPKTTTERYINFIFFYNNNDDDKINM